mgnify:FL=1
MVLGWLGSISDSTAADGASSGDYRVIRGGGWDDYGYLCQVGDYGSVASPHIHNFSIGFRVVRQAN